MVKIKEEIKICFLIELSNKRNIPIDEDELPIVLKGIASGKVVILKQGIFNPSFFVDIVKDEKRIQEIIDDNRLNRFAIEQGMKKPKKLKPLEDIFKEAKDKYLLKAPK